MAEDRTFVLIGDFKDNITPALDSINKSIASFKTQLASLSNRRGGGFNEVTKSVGKLIASQKHLKDSIKEVGDAAKYATGELKEYKTLVGKVASAHYHIKRSGTAAGRAQAKFWEGANRNLNEYKNNMASLNRMTRVGRVGAGAPRQIRRPRGGGGGGGGYGGTPYIPGGGGGGMRPSREHRSYAAGVGGGILGNTIG